MPACQQAEMKQNSNAGEYVATLSTVASAGSPLSVGDHVLCGGGAGVASALIACPTELLKCRLQVSHPPANVFDTRFIPTGTRITLCPNSSCCMSRLALRRDVEEGGMLKRVVRCVCSLPEVTRVLAARWAP